VLLNNAVRNVSLLVLIATASGLLVGCRREVRDYRTDPPVSTALDDIALMPGGIGGAPPDVYVALSRPYESNAYNLSMGKQLYSWFGCRSCHADGEGGSGPAFLDGWWHYGADVVSIFASIRDGRPGGMPAFKNQLTTDQVWQLAGYVQTIGAYSAVTAAPGRNDEKQTRPAENRAPANQAPLEPPAR
jgi:cytochrome c oxidase cbb3-type subunit 3